MKTALIDDVKKIQVPTPGSHKGQNGRLLIIGGSHLFHAASLWSLTVASRIVDLVHYASVPENNEIVRQAKEVFRNGIVISREDIEDYIKEDDVILIGPGMVRTEESKVKSQKSKVKSIAEIEKITNEGEQTEALTNYLLAKYPEKQWVIDAGALQMMDVSLIPKNAILTPHHGEFIHVFTNELPAQLRSGQNFLDPIDEDQVDAEVVNENLDPSSVSLAEMSHISKKHLSRSQSEAGQNFVDSPHRLMDSVKFIAKQHHCIVLLKGEKDIACSGGDCDASGVCAPTDCRIIKGGNPGMTKGGTGDVLAGLIAALACTNDPFVSTIAGSFINKQAGDALYAAVGPYFNATDLANEIPVTMKKFLLDSR